MKVELFQELANRWPSPIVARHEVSRFSGGAIHPRTLANLDSRGEGPRGRFRIGRKVCYPTVALIEWMKARAEAV
ncbi:MAG: hypothetical protein JRI83_07560 [Deltaproteobacteria bacterium]|nr:hypothetical protein [Deltaproteobacteria bacterium]